MKIFYIAPHYLDSSFEKKLSILKSIAIKFDSEIFKGVKSDNSNFDLLNTMHLFKSADSFIADLSYERPSCYYELGYLQGQGREVHLIANKGTTIHQKIGEVEFYENFEQYSLIIERIIKKMKDQIQLQ